MDPASSSARPSRARELRQAFDPGPHEVPLRAIIDAVGRAPVLDARTLDRIVRQHPRRGQGLFSKSQIIAGFRAFGPGESGLREEAFLARLRLRPVRTLSGVTPVTVLTRPHPCPGRCLFCPSDVRMPKSYLADEPGAQRAEDNDFDPYLQTWNRLSAYRDMGHPVDKIELIVLGGTWSHYPEPYQVWFIQRCLDALSDFGEGRDERADAGVVPASFRTLPPLDGRNAEATYNQRIVAALGDSIGGLLHPAERADWDALAGAQRRNESAPSRCVGLVVETRPDEIDEAEALRLRRLGATKLQIGIQSLRDAVLAANRRGHDVATSRRALQLARAAGFKIHAHWMPNLLGATPEGDAADYRTLFADPDFRPDELKIYPCMLVESAALMGPWERGEWAPYDDAVLTELLADCLEHTPRWCRLTRVIRDFSAHDITAGTRRANLREVAAERLRERGGRCEDIRGREIRGAGFDPKALRLQATVYATSLGQEQFLELVTPDDRLIGFLRLSLPGQPSFVEELGDSAVIREVHVYGASLPLGARGAAQHGGFGGALVEEACRRARAHGYPRLAVISAIGTRPWYRRLGFEDGVLYQHRALG